MFEQSLYNQPEPEQQKPQEGDLFRNYEVGRWNYSKRIYQIFAIAAVFNILGIVFLAQTNVLTARGCDSPFVGRVCQVLDTVYIGALLFGTEREYVDVAYERTELADADITFIDVSTPLFEYPANYFQPPAIDPYAAQLDPMSDFSAYPPGFTPNPTVGNDIMNTKPILPKPNPVQDDGPDSLFGTVADPPKTTPGMARKRKFGKGKVPDETVAQATATPTPELEETPKVTTTDPATGYELNKKPFKDLGNYVNDLLAKKQVSLDAPFDLRAKGKLQKDGKLDAKTFKFEQVATSDAKMAEVVKESIEAINDSGYLQYLELLSGKDFQLEVKQDDTTVNAIVQSELENDSRARSIASALNLMKGYAINRKKGVNADQNDKDDLMLLDGAKIEAIGKRVVITFNVPKALAQGLIQRKLQEQAAELKKENGTAVITPNNNTAKK